MQKYLKCTSAGSSTTRILACYDLRGYGKLSSFMALALPGDQFWILEMFCISRHSPSTFREPWEGKVVRKSKQNSSNN